jgi:gluconokinase
MSTVLDEVSLESAPELASLLSSSVRAEPHEPVVLALDIGTSGVRAALFDGRGEEIEGSQTTLLSDLYPALRSGSDSDADALVELVARTIDILLERTADRVSRVDYVAASCYWHSLVGIGKESRAVTPLLGWADTRAAKFAEELRTTFDESVIHARTGCRFHPSYWPAKLLWLKSEQGEFFEKTKRWLSFADYLALRLFGETTTSVSMASATGLFDQRAVDWDSELSSKLKLSTDKLPTIAPPGMTFSGLRDEFAMRWPILDRAAWFPAIGDGAANNVGAGCVDRDRVALMIGTSGAMRVLFCGDPPSSLPPELFCYRVDRDRVVIGGALSDGGGLHGWMKETLELEPLDDDELDREIGLMEPDAHGLTILPFWAGERSPGWSTAARGTIAGLRATTKPLEILRAAMEAISYRFALIARALEKVAPKAEIVAAGNALLASPTWLQMIADVLGRPITLAPVKEASCRGAALLALEAIGKIDNLESRNGTTKEVIEPNLARHRVYLRAIERQQELYEKLIGHRGTETQRSP